MSDHQVTVPSKPRVINEHEFTGTYEIDGLYPGYGHTLGNSLRRIILSSLPGAAITSVKIDGVSHEFSTIEGVAEDTIMILLNLKKVRIKMLTDEPQVMKIKVKGPKTVTAADIDAPSQVEILSPEQHIAEVSGKVDFEVEIGVERGLGYVAKEVLQKERVDIGAIALDALFSPIRRVNYEVENMRVGDRTDFNRLRMFIETDGTLTPREALEDAIATMILQLKAVIGFQEEVVVEKEEEAVVAPAVKKAEAAEKKDADKEAFKTRVDELDLSPRVAASLDEAGIRTVGGLARKHEEDILGIEGLGQKGLQEIKRSLSNLGITLRN